MFLHNIFSIFHFKILYKNLPVTFYSFQKYLKLTKIHENKVSKKNDRFIPQKMYPRGVIVAFTKGNMTRQAIYV